MTEPALLDMVRELDPASSGREPEPDFELHVDELDEAELSAKLTAPIHMPRLVAPPTLDEDDCLLDPWFQRSEEEIAMIEDDPTAKVHEIRIARLPDDYGTGFDDNR
jgi:hypothetical protein